MAPAPRLWVRYGTVARAHGIRGELRVVPLNFETMLPAGIETVRLVSRAGAAREYRVQSLRPIHRAVLMTLDGVADRDAAQALAHSALEIAVDALPASAGDEVYVYELIGAGVCDESGAPLGHVLRVVAVRENDLLEIATPRGERLLPLVPAFILGFDRARRLLTVRVVDGLWD